jgi:hypothetical protein
VRPFGINSSAMSDWQLATRQATLPGDRAQGVDEGQPNSSNV